MIILETRFKIHAQSLTIAPHRVVAHIAYIERVEDDQTIYPIFVTQDDTISAAQFSQDVEALEKRLNAEDKS